MSVTAIIITIIVVLLLFGSFRWPALLEIIGAVTRRDREEEWRQLSEIWSGQRGGLRLLLLILGFVVLIVTFALVRVSGMLIWVGVLVAWLAFITAILSKVAEGKNSSSSDNGSETSSLRSAIITVIVFTIILIAGLLFFSNATANPR